MCERRRQWTIQQCFFYGKTSWRTDPIRSSYSYKRDMKMKKRMFVSREHYTKSHLHLNIFLVAVVRNGFLSISWLNRVSFFFFIKNLSRAYNLSRGMFLIYFIRFLFFFFLYSCFHDLHFFFVMWCFCCAFDSLFYINFMKNGSFLFFFNLMEKKT